MSDGRDGPVNTGRRRVLRGTVQIAAGGAMAAFAPRLAAPVVAQGRGGSEGGAGTAAEAGTRVVLLGTQGGPNVTLRRSEASSAVIVDGRPYLVDCGYGTLRALVESGVGYLQIGEVFLTHLHNDHTSDLPALLSHQWTGSRMEPTVVYGPPGTARLVSAAVAFLEPDAEIRSVDEGRTVPPKALYRGQDLPAGAPARAFADDRVKVTCVENAHYEDHAKSLMPHRSVSYRFDTSGRSVVFSGDTAYSKGLVALAAGADLFVCEVMSVPFYESMMAQAKAEAAKGNVNSIARHIAETHVTTVDVGRMAAEAKVKTVVLTHIVPASRPGSTELPETTYIDGVRRHFSGQVIVGRDQMVL